VKPCVSNEECAVRCDDADAPSCTTIGKRYYHGDNGLTENDDKAKTSFQRACIKKDPEGCYLLAVSFKEDIIASYTTACDGGWAWACTNLGVQYAQGKGVAADPERARALAEKACKLEDSMACSNLGMYLMNGSGGPKDLPRAITLSRGACDADEGEACARLAQMYDEGNGTAKDQVTARKIYIRACDLDAGCNNLGVMYDAGEGGDVDIEKAKEAFEKACEKKSGLGCVNRARFWRDGRDGSTNRGEAARLFARGCQLGESEGCDELERVVSAMEKSCKKDAKECTNFGWVTENGIGMDANAVAAAKLYERACTAKAPVACENLGKFHRDGGAGFTVDPERALTYFDKACKLSRKQACVLATELRAK